MYSPILNALYGDFVLELRGGTLRIDLVDLVGIVRGLLFLPGAAQSVAQPWRYSMARRDHETRGLPISSS
jgi:hypothetical protein